MHIRVTNIHGDRILLPPQTKSALDSLGIEVAASEANWEETTQKMVRILGFDGFEVMKLQPEISYSNTKDGKKIEEIKFYYSGM
jgi:hypothetical protein